MPKDSTNKNVAKPATKPSAGADKTKNTLKRNRACHQCRKRKMKCDARKPVCTTCSRSHLHLKLHPPPGFVLSDMPECTYDDIPEFEENPSQRIEFLEKKIHQLESLLSDTLTASFPQSNAMLAGMEPSIFVEPTKSVTDMPLNLSIAPLASLEDGFNADAHPFYNGNPSPLDSSSSSSDSFPNSVSDTAPLDVFWDDWPHELPRIDFVRSYAKSFFSSHYHANRLLHRETFMSSLDLHPSDSNFPSPAILHALCAMGSITEVLGLSPGSSDRVRVAAAAERQFALAKANAETDISQGARLLQAQQALLLCGWWAWCHARWVEVYCISARILRNCLPLGLNASEGFQPLTDTPVATLLPPPRDAAEAEVRRNVFWLAYALERQSGCGHGWPLSLDDIDVSQLLPVSYEAFALGFSWPPDPQRQHPFTPNFLLAHLPDQTDAFGLWIKGTILLSRVKNYNMRYHQRRARNDPALELLPGIEQHPEWNTVSCPTQFPDDPRKTRELVELDTTANVFEESLNIRLPQPLTSENIDPYLYTAHLMPYVAIMMLHDPHASMGSMSCLSTRRLLSSSRAVLRLILIMHNSEINLALLDQFAFFSWFMAGKTLTRFWEVARRVNAQDQAAIFRAEVEQVAAVLCRAGRFVPLPKRYFTMLSENAARVCGEKLSPPQLIPAAAHA